MSGQALAYTLHLSSGASEPRSGYRVLPGGLVIQGSFTILTAPKFTVETRDSDIHDAVQGPLDFQTREAEFRLHAQQVGVDLDELLEAAGRHLTSDRIQPRQEPPTEQEVESFIEHELNGFE